MKLIKSNNKVQYVIEHQNDNWDNQPLITDEYSFQDYCKIVQNLHNEQCKNKFKKMYIMNTMIIKQNAFIMLFAQIIPPLIAKEWEEVVNYFKNNLDFWEAISSSPKMLEYIDVQEITSNQNKINWSKLLSFNIDKRYIVPLLKDVKNDDFWRELSLNPHYIPLLTTEMLIEHQCLSWQNILSYHDFSDDEKQYLLDNVINNNFWKIIGNFSPFIKFLTYDLIMKHKSDIDFHYAKLEDLTFLTSLSEEELNMLIIEIPSLSKFKAKNISHNFRLIKDVPRGKYCTFGNSTDMHDHRDGAFVIVKVSNGDYIIKSCEGNYHYDLIKDICEEYGYNFEMLIDFCCNIEDNPQKLQKILNINNNVKNSGIIQSCCGYVHIDENKENPIAIIDVGRCHNMSSTTVAQLLEHQTYNDMHFIGVGISNYTSTFIKIAKKRLKNFKMLYWY